MRISSYPKLFLESIQVEIRFNGYSNCIISLNNLERKILRMMGVSISAGLNQIRLDGPDSLSAGPYLLQVMDTVGKCIYESGLTKQ
jgi:hypothetical protein